jgi:hypothetical protein
MTAEVMTLARRMEMAVMLAKLSTKDIGPLSALQTAVEAFVETVEEDLKDTGPQATKVPEVKAVLESIKALVARFPHTAKAKQGDDYTLSVTTSLALAGPALLFALDIVDAVLDDNYGLEGGK